MNERSSSNYNTAIKYHIEFRIIELEKKYFYIPCKFHLDKPEVFTHCFGLLTYDEGKEDPGGIVVTKQAIAFVHNQIRNLVVTISKFVCKGRHEL